MQRACGLWAKINDLVKKNIPLVGNTVSLGSGVAQMPSGMQTEPREGLRGRENGEGWAAMVGGSH